MSMPFIHPGRRLGQSGDLRDFEDELAALAEAGVGGVVSLLNIPSDARLYEQAGFEFACLPVPDGNAPEFRQVKEFVRFVEGCRAQSKAVAVHCEAGCGRTGTMIAAYLIVKGATPDVAIARVRSAEPSAIETNLQIRFLFELPGSLERPGSRN